MFSNTFAVIAPASAPGFVIAAQLFGALLGVALILALDPEVRRTADDVATAPAHGRALMLRAERGRPPHP